MEFTVMLCLPATRRVPERWRFVRSWSCRSESSRLGLLAGFAGDEDDAAPIFALHPWQVMAAKAHAAHHVERQRNVPVGVGNIRKSLGSKIPTLIDGDIGFGSFFCEGLGLPEHRR